MCVGGQVFQHISLNVSEALRVMAAFTLGVLETGRTVNDMSAAPQLLNIRAADWGSSTGWFSDISEVTHTSQCLESAHSEHYGDQFNQCC